MSNPGLARLFKPNEYSLEIGETRVQPPPHHHQLYTRQRSSLRTLVYIQERQAQVIAKVSEDSGFQQPSQAGIRIHS